MTHAALEFGPGERIAAGDIAGTWIFDMKTGRELLFFGGATEPHFSPDGKKFATICGGMLNIWRGFPLQDEDLPGDSSMSYDERIQLHKLEQWKKRQKALAEAEDNSTTASAASKP